MSEGMGYSCGEPNILITQRIDVPGSPLFRSKFGKSEKSTGFELLVIHLPWEPKVQVKSHGPLKITIGIVLMQGAFNTLIKDY